jgi:hypothetical protein
VKAFLVGMGGEPADGADLAADRHVRDAAGPEQAVEVPHDLLGAADGEGRDEQHARGRADLAHDVGQEPDGLSLRIVLTTAVSGLH